MQTTNKTNGFKETEIGLIPEDWKVMSLHACIYNFHKTKRDKNTIKPILIHKAVIFVIASFMAFFAYWFCSSSFIQMSEKRESPSPYLMVNNADVLALPLFNGSKTILSFCLS